MSDTGIEKLMYGILLYLPLTIIIALFVIFIGSKILRIAKEPQGLSGFFTDLMKKLFNIKASMKKFTDIIWPDKNAMRDGKSGASIQMETVLIILGGLYIFLMIILYNDYLYLSLKDKSKNLLYKIFNPILKFFFPNTWFSVQRNIRLKSETTFETSIKDKFPLLLGGVGLFLGFTIFMYLLVNEYNLTVKKTINNHRQELFEKANKYIYLTIFTGVVLGLFAGLLYYAATSNTAPKIITTLLIALSVIIILAAVFLLFRKQILKYLDNPFIKVIYNFIFVIPCLFIDLINFIYYELKSSPKAVFIIFALEVLFIASIFIVPIVTKWMYLALGKDKQFKNKIDNEIIEVKNRITKINRAIKIIKNFNPDKQDFRKITVEGNSIHSERIDPKSLKVSFIKKIRGAPILRVFCMDYNKNNFSGEIEYRGVMNVITGKIKWNYIKTLNGWHNNFYTDILKNKCQWQREKVDSDFQEKYMGINEKAPTDIKKVPMNLKELVATYSPYQIKELKEALNLRKTMLAEKNIDYDKDLFKVIKEKLTFVKDKIRDVMTNSDITANMVISSNNLNEGAWERIIKYNLDNDENLYRLNRMLRGYGFKDETACQAIIDRYKRRKCKDNYKKLVKHIQVNTRQLILFYNTLEELDNRIKDLEKMKKQGNNLFDKGIQCLKEPVYFRKKMYLQNHNKFLKIRPEEHSYNYSISCWFFVHSNPPNFKKSYNKYTKILNFNFEPVIAYNGKKNTLLIKSFKASGKKKNDLITLYKKNKFKLQKWHNIVVNYIGGTVDVFLNGKIVGSVNRVAPYKTFNNLIVGEDAGVSGSICNVVYFPNYISNSKISLNYNYLKKKSPPVI